MRAIGFLSAMGLADGGQKFNCRGERISGCYYGKGWQGMEPVR